MLNTMTQRSTESLIFLQMLVFLLLFSYFGQKLTQPLFIYYFFLAYKFCHFAALPAVVLKGNQSKPQGNRDTAWSRRGES